MTQTKLGSLLEAMFNVLIGFWVNFAANLVILPHFGFHPSISTTIEIGVFFTFVSVARTYLIRRFVATGMHKVALNLAKRWAT